MFGSPISWYIIAYTLFDLLVKTHLTVHDSSHGKYCWIVANCPNASLVSGFINHEKYLVDDMGSYHEVSSADNIHVQTTIHNNNFCCPPGLFDRNSVSLLVLKATRVFSRTFFADLQLQTISILNICLSLNQKFWILNNGICTGVFKKMIFDLCMFRPLGVPHLEKVMLHNVHNNRSIDMTSISGSTVHFHSSFFEDKVS